MTYPEINDIIERTIIIVHTESYYTTKGKISMARKHGLDELNSEDIAKAAEGMTLRESGADSGTSYMDDIAEIYDPDSIVEAAESLPGYYNYDADAYDLEYIDTPYVDDSQELPETEDLDSGFHVGKHPPASAYDLEHIDVPDFSDDEELPLQEEQSPDDPYFALIARRRKRKPASAYDLEHVAVPQFGDNDALPVTEDIDSGFHVRPHPPASAYDLEDINVPDFSDNEALPDIGPVYVKPSVIRKPRRRMDDDFPMPIKAATPSAAGQSVPPKPSMSSMNDTGRGGGLFGRKKK